MFRFRYVFFVAVLALSLSGPIGCSGGGPSPCTDDTSCTDGQKCNVTTGKCEGGSSGACTANTDCGDKKVCDNSKCYDDCSVDGFAGCDPGNTCDEATSKRCKCDDTKCAAVGNSGCHPVTNVCDNFCDPSKTGDCTGDEKCVPTAADPSKGFCQKPKSCTADTDCSADTNYPKCDTAKGFCIPESKCADDAACKGNANGEKCEKTSGKCVKCLADADCDTAKSETCDTTTNTCKAPTGCQNSKTCYEATAKTYCGEKGKACSAAPKATCDNMVADEESLTSEWDNNTKGMVIWNLKEIERKTTNNCVSGGSKSDCTDNSDCSGGEVCFQKKCYALQKNGEVSLEFSFYAPEGIQTGYTAGKDKDGNPNFSSGTDRKKGDGWGDLSSKLEIKDGDSNEGVARFTVCASAAFNAWFAFSDTKAEISNAACVDISDRN